MIILFSDVKCAIGILKLHKDPGEDTIYAGMLKLLNMGASEN